MSLKDKRFIHLVIEFFYYGFERIFKIWQVMSWVTMLMGYSFLIVANVLFTMPPGWLKVFGFSGVFLTTVNVFIATFVAFIYVVKAIREKEMELVKPKILLIILYNIVAGILYFSSTL